MRTIVCFLCLCLCAATIVAQDDAWEDFAEDFALDEEVAENEDWQDYLLELKELHEHPLNINTATYEQLSQLPFLTDEQIEDIHAYIYVHGEMKTLGELMLLPRLDGETRRRLRFFVYAGEAPKPKKGFFGRIRQEFNTRLDIPLYYRRGYMVDNGYRDDALYHRMRYTLKSNHLQAGLRIEKDSGERFYDSHGGYVLLKDVGRLHRLVVGDYRAGFGEGLVMGGGSWNIKSNPTMRAQTGLRPMTGMSESGFLRGAAATLDAGRGWSVSAFASYQSVDATLTGQGDVKTFVTTGYHRTGAEKEKKHNTQSATAGANVDWHHGSLYVGATGYYQSFSRTLSPGDEAYRRIYPSGSHFGAMGVHYGYRWRDLVMAGETATNADRWGIATLNRLTYILSAQHRFTVVQRYYSSDYYSFHAAAMGESSRVQNENGVLVHWRGEPWGGWHFVAYADFFYHRWPTYGMTHSNQGQEVMGQATYTPDGRHEFMASYRWKNKETYDNPDPHHRAKAQWTFTPNVRWKVRASTVLHCSTSGAGVGVQALAQYALPHPALQWSATLAYAHTPDYQTRVYFYEPSLYQTISNASLYGHCVHGALTARWTTCRDHLVIEGRYTMLRFFDRTEQSSAMQTIYSPWKNDLQVQVRVKF